MLFFIFNWLGVILLSLGVGLFVIRPLFVLKAKKGPPLTARRKMWLWFFQVAGFWSVFIGGWMVTEGYIKSKIDQAEEAAEDAAEEAEELAAKKKENKKKKKKKERDANANAEDDRKEKKNRRKKKSDDDDD